MKQVTISIREDTHSDALKFGINISKTARLAIEKMVEQLKGGRKE